MNPTQYCNTCGVAVPQGSKFCNDCGAHIVKSVGYASPEVSEPVAQPVSAKEEALPAKDSAVKKVAKVIGSWVVMLIALGFIAEAVTTTIGLGSVQSNPVLEGICVLIALLVFPSLLIYKYFFRDSKRRSKA